MLGGMGWAERRTVELSYTTSRAFLCWASQPSIGNFNSVAFQELDGATSGCPIVLRISWQPFWHCSNPGTLGSLVLGCPSISLLTQLLGYQRDLFSKDKLKLQAAQSGTAHGTRSPVMSE